MLAENQQPETEVIETIGKVEGGESVESEKAGEPEAEKEKAKKRLSDRLREQTYHRRQAERERDELKQKVNELSAKVEKKDEPDPEDYGDRQKYLADRDAWKAQETKRLEAEVEQKLKAKAAQESQQQIFEKQKDGYIKSRADAIKEDAEFHNYEKEIDKVVEAFDAPEIQDLILAASKQGPQIVSYLGKNPDELEEIASASPRQRTFLMGKLVAKLEAKPVKKISSAPDPVRSEKGGVPVKAAPKGLVFDKSKESFSQYAARINGKK